MGVMLRRYILLINLVFILLVLFFGNRIYGVWKPGTDLNQRLSQPPSNQASFSLPALLTSPKHARTDYQVIIDKDLFRPERTEWRIHSKQKQKDVNHSRTELNLTVYGIVISDDLTFAWIKLAGKNQKIKKVTEGDSMEGWTVSRIDADYVELTGGEKSVKHNLIKKGQPKSRTIPKSPITKKPRRKPSRSSSPKVNPRDKK